MAVAYINKTIELPTVTAQRISREIVGERSSTALGKLRQDVVRVRRAWRLECRFLTQAQYTAIISHMESVSWAAVPFWLDEFGGTASANGGRARPTTVLPTLVKIRDPLAATPTSSSTDRRRQTTYMTTASVRVMNTIDGVAPRFVNAVTQRSPAGERSEMARSRAGWSRRLTPVVFATASLLAISDFARFSPRGSVAMM